MGLFNFLKNWWQNSFIDHRLERFLSDSSDLADLEHRQRKWTYMSEAEKNRYYMF